MAEGKVKGVCQASRLSVWLAPPGETEKNRSCSLCGETGGKPPVRRAECVCLWGSHTVTRHTGP